MALSALPAAAFAARAYVTGGTQMHAGPGNDYPVVASLGRGVAVNVNGCISDYSWCDINLGANRGWVYAGELAYPYHNGRVAILEYGPRLALPTVTFSVGNYWDRYYRTRPFYGERTQWEQHWRDHGHEHEQAHADNRRDHRDDHGNARYHEEHDRADHDRSDHGRPGERERSEVR